LEWPNALEIALKALEIGPAHEVVTVGNAGGYASSAICSLGARPVYVDVDPVRLTMSAAALERAISASTRAVVVTHLYGRLADMEKIMPIARRHGVFVIEDCAHSHGARANGKRAGSWGDIACFSFYPTKNLGALGDGGQFLPRMLDWLTWCKACELRLVAEVPCNNQREATVA
jgi:dTDP-4-amino-4,6-dideoxygalactose transaminase